MYHGVFDQQGNPLESYDLERGRLVESSKTIHHDAVEAVEQRSHLEVVREYPNGGKDVRRVIDTPGVEARGAWDEVVPILIYEPFTDEELAAMEAERSKPTQAEQIAELREALELLLAGVTE